MECAGVIVRSESALPLTSANDFVMPVKCGPRPRRNSIRRSDTSLFLLIPFRTALVFWWAIVPSLIAGTTRSQTELLRFDHITTAQGLSQDIVSSIVQDREGFMWFATENGLNRYDGYSIRVYKHNPRDSSSIPGNVISSLFIDGQGALWVFTSTAMSRYDATRDAFSHISIDAVPTSACEDRSGTLWVSTQKGLRRLDLRTNKLTSHAMESDVGEVFGLGKGRSGALWMATRSGLFQFDPSRNTVRQHHAAGTGLVVSVLEDSHGSLWFVPAGGGLRRINMTDNTVDTFDTKAKRPGRLLDDRVMRLYEDRQGTIWVGTFGGLERYDPARKRFDHFQSDPSVPHSLSANRVYSIVQDRDGAIWVGTYRGGVSKTDPYNRKFEHYFHAQSIENGLPANDVLALMEDAHGDLWVGAGSGGVTRYSRDTHRFTSMFLDRGWGATAAIQEDDRGRLWIGTQGTGLVCYNRNTNTLRHYRHQRDNPSSIGDDNIQSLFVDRDGVLWMGFSDQGLDRYDEQTDSFRHFWPDNRYANVGVWSIQEDRRGTLWLGNMYAAAGMYSFDKATGVFTPPDRMSTGSPVISSVRAMYEDSKGVFWLGSWGGGLYRYDPVTRVVTQFNELDGLANDFVKGMLADSRENLWMSTENGLSKFDPRTGTFRTFTSRDGLQGNFFWSGSFCKGKDGRMYFGGTHGFTAFHPDSVRDNPNIPSVMITRFTVLNEPVVLAQSGGTPGEVELSYEQDLLSFDFVALNYAAPEKNQYAYMMEGLDEDWVYAGTRRYATYGHVDPGSYIFRVKGSNNDGVWNERGASLAVTITPPYWQTFWFRGLIVLLVVSVLYSLYRYRMGRLLEVERLRARIAADLHDDVGSNLSSIAIASQLIGRKVELPHNERLQLAEIGATALRTSEMMKEIVWLLNPKNDDLDDVLLKMKAVAESMLRGIPYTFHGPPGKIAEKVNLDTKRNLFMMYKEILNNIVQHASATDVSIQVVWEHSKLLLTIRDNGKGFDLEATPAGNGLQNLQTRSKRIGGELGITSSPLHGTTVSLAIEIT